MVRIIIVAFSVCQHFHICQKGGEVAAATEFEGMKGLG